MSENLPALDDCGFVRLPGEPALWMTCDQCKKSDHFWLEEGVRCRCGARYSHAIRPDGTTIPLEDLRFVPFEQGPKSLADLEVDPKRAALLAVVVLGLIGAVIWFLFG